MTTPDGDAVVLLLDNEDVRRVLDMPTAIDALRTGYADLAVGDATYVPRIDIFAPTGRPDDFYQWGSMSGVSMSFGVLAVRMKSDVVSWPEGRTQEKHCVRPGQYCGLIVVFRVSDGAPVAFVHDGYLQHLRVGAAAGIGADVLARRDSAVLGLLGSGGMAEAYLDAIAAVRPIQEVRVYSPTPEHRQAFAEQAALRHTVRAKAVATAEEAVRGADIVATATDSMRPTFDPAWIDVGAHVTCVTRRELSTGLVRRADRTVQLGVQSIPRDLDIPMMTWQAGGMAAYVCGRETDRERVPKSSKAQRGTHPTLLDVQLERAAGRASDGEVTLFVNVGTQGLQFASVAGKVWQLATALGIGRRLPMGWFLEEIRD